MKSDVSSLSNMTKIYDAVVSFENTALANMKIAESLMNKGASTANGPVINRWLQAGRAATGDPDVAAFNTAMGAVTGEYGKIISGGSASAAATPEGARKEAQDWLDKIQSPDALAAQFSVARQDMENRRVNLEAQRNTIQQRMESGEGMLGVPGASRAQSAVPASAISLPPAAVAQLTEGHVTTFANGQKWTLRDGKPEQVP